MQPSLTFIRNFFILICAFISIGYAISQTAQGVEYIHIIIKILLIIIFCYSITYIGNLSKNLNLRLFNTATLGLFFGYCMGEAIWKLFQSALEPIKTELTSEVMNFIRMGIILSATYLGLLLTLKNSEDLYFSIPFIKFQSGGQKRKNLLIDPSALMDARIIDLASSGIVDSMLILPRYIVKEYSESIDNPDEGIRAKAKRSLEIIKKLECLPYLELRYTEINYADVSDTMTRYIQLAQLLNANILTADINRMSQPGVEGIRLVNVNALGGPFKPHAQLGEHVQIKIQRYGKDPRQGIGYLEDGTMVVVNGGAEFIGENIRAQILSVKHTSSGRMIFCNANEENMTPEPALATAIEGCDSSIKNYFAH